MLYGHINTSSSLSICLLSPLHFVCFFFSSICFVLIYFPISTIHLETASLWHFAATVVASFISFTAKLYYNMHKSAFESCQSMKSVSALERFNFYGTLKMNKLLITVKWLARNQTQYVYAVDWMECARASAQCKLIRLISIQSGFSNCRNRYFEERIQLNGDICCSDVIAFMHRCVTRVYDFVIFSRRFQLALQRKSPNHCGAVVHKID